MIRHSVTVGKHTIPQPTPTPQYVMTMIDHHTAPRVRPKKGRTLYQQSFFFRQRAKRKNAAQSNDVRASMNRLANGASNGCVQDRPSIVQTRTLLLITSFELLNYLASPAACMFFDFAFVIW